MQIFKAMGNIGKPRALDSLERSLWALVLQVAQGGSVYDLLPVYMSAWGADIDSGEVEECKSWLDDFGKQGRDSCNRIIIVAYRYILAEEANDGPIKDWDEADLVQMGKDYAAQRDEQRPWKSDVNANNKRRNSSPVDPMPSKKRVIPLIFVSTCDFCL